jgi:general stress protein YciG
MKYGSNQKLKRGFAAISPERQKAIASMGGKAAHRAGTAHKWDSAEAQEAGRKGGSSSRGGRGKAPVEP